MKDEHGLPFWKKAEAKLPGENYFIVLRRIHALLKPGYYLEIGVASGASLTLALENSYAIGVDPEPLIIFPFRAWTKICRLASDEFFTTYSGEPFDLIFLDGLHTYDALVKDFCNAEKFCRPHSVILIHDTIPLTAETSKPIPPEQNPKDPYWTGDVWKIVPALIKGRPDLKIFTIPCYPSGLTVVKGFGRPKGIPSAIIEEFKNKDFTWVDPQWQTRLNVVGNEPEAWQALLK